MMTMMNATKTTKKQRNRTSSSRIRKKIDRKNTTATTTPASSSSCCCTSTSSSGISMTTLLKIGFVFFVVFYCASNIRFSMKMFGGESVTVEIFGITPTTQDGGGGGGFGVFLRPRNNDSNEVVVKKNVPFSSSNDDDNESNNSNSDSDSDSFSACLLWMDDNFRLEEWLAYHYYILKLRYVVINIDPNSRTSPMDIITRWNNNNYHHLNMTIVTMTDTDHFTSKEYEDKMQVLEYWKNSTDTARYSKAKSDFIRNRQKQFYRSCSKHLLELNKTWVSYHDVDEFITFSNSPKQIIVNGTTTVVDDGLRKMNQPGYILDRLNEIKAEDNKANYDNGFSCVVIDRVRYNSKELSTTSSTTTTVTTTHDKDNDYGYDDESLQLKEIYNIPDFVDTKRFDTLRYKYNSGPDGMPKSFIDLSQKRPREFTQNNNSKWMVHKPMQYHCFNESRTRNENTKNILTNEKFIVNHYLGSWASFSYRNDARKGGLRSYDLWFERSTMTTRKGGTSIMTWSWMNGFLDLIGGRDGNINNGTIKEIAMYLFRDAGEFGQDYNATSNIVGWKKNPLYP